jgi:multicomponent Na+:H+ antiporter subunit A
VTAFVLGICAAAFAAPWLARRTGAFAGWLLAALPTAVLVWAIRQAPAIVSGTAVVESRPWVEGLGVALAFRLDGWSLPFVVLVSGLGALVLPYAGRYKARHPQLGWFLGYLTAFMGAMLGLVLADDAMTLFVFWELTSVASFLLIGFEHRRAEARRAAQQALLLTGVGGLALLAGLVLFGMASSGGSLGAAGGSVTDHALYPAILGLVLAGAFSKSAQVPLHFWLPNAMEAPTPASAYLHSATMVKAGVYLLGRLAPALGETPAWHWSLGLVGGGTMVLGGVLALRQHDLKRVLAYTTVTALGTLVLLIGIGTPAAMQAAVVLLWVHGLYKGALFFCAGLIDHATGTRDVRTLRGLGRRLPLTSTAMVVAGLSMAGLPPLLGFVAKELGYGASLATVQGAMPAWLGTSVLLFANAATVAAAWIVVRPVFGTGPGTTGEHGEPPSMGFAALVPAVAGLVLGLGPAVLDGMVGAASGAATVHLALWHGVNRPLLLSVATLLLAGLILVGRRYGPRWPALRLPRADDVYDRGLGALRWTAAQTSALLQTGYTSRYLASILWTTLVLVGGSFALRGHVPAIEFGPLALYEFTIGALVIAAAGVVAVARSRTLAILGLGVVGFGAATLFLVLGAPDVAMTQLLVETMVVIIALAALRWLPRMPVQRRARPSHIVLSVAVGTLVGGLVLVTASVPAPSEASRFFIEKSLSEAHGRNVVNVILVDFRALDTLGEITVVAVAALGALALIQAPPGSARKEHPA